MIYDKYERASQEAMPVVVGRMRRRKSARQRGDGLVEFELQNWVAEAVKSSGRSLREGRRPACTGDDPGEAVRRLIEDGGAPLGTPSRGRLRRMAWGPVGEHLFRGAVMVGIIMMARATPTGQRGEVSPFTRSVKTEMPITMEERHEHVAVKRTQCKAAATELREVDAGAMPIGMP